MQKPFSTYRLTTFQAQYWNGSAWVTVPNGSITGNSNVWKQITFSPITTTKIRIWITGSSDGYSRMTEVEAWGVPTGSSSATVQWLISYHLGTPRMVLDQTDNLANMKRHDYLPFGEELVAPTGGRSTALGYSTGDGVRQQFTQKERDNETGLDFFEARYFGSTQGRFTNPDPHNPIVDSEKEEDFDDYLGQPQNWNRYAFVWNNPLKYVDLNGEKVYVVTYTTGNSVDNGGDAELRRAAETRAKQIRSAKGFDAKKDTVLLRGVQTKQDFAKVINEANGLNKQFGKVEQINLYAPCRARIWSHLPRSLTI